MIHTRRYVNKAKYAPKMTDSLKPLDVAELLKEEIDCGNIPFEIVSEVTGIPVKRVERIYRNDLPKEDEMVSILEWVGKNES
ncbi:hypothetical protein QSV38_02325 [Streptococcus parasuis]|uniref:hypothetical protein n=1 Tax=Streptococcus parasuis TaxID=1501662 RepID=UPI0025A651D6|nr:hypothetical protein [Streptococcus parasuis]WJQ86119.1 hypothetical protein QSV38_02325 [Streptococcus parasuis]